MHVYHTLLINDGTPGNAWGVAFGDYDRTAVADELLDYRSHGWPLKDLKIIRTDGSQAEIDAAVAALNA